DITFVAVEGVPDSMLGLVWRRADETARLRAFGRAVAELCAQAAAEPMGGRVRT
ncbi:hypothetical protein JBE27_24480, partial [Streptomyces albiflaviniger]|nr:hypothetical protein [Streptomyces albiflaviniger]